MKTLILTFAAALATVALAQEPANPGEGAKPERRAVRPMGPRGDRMPAGLPMMMDSVLRMTADPQFAAKLGLTDDQAAKLKEIAKDRGRDRDAQKQIRKCMDRQAELLGAEKIDEAAVMATVDELCEARKASMKDYIKRMIAARAVLTPEQLEKAKSLVNEFRGGRRPQRPAKDKPAAAPKAE